MADSAPSTVDPHLDIFQELEALRHRCGLSNEDFIHRISDYVLEVLPESDFGISRRTKSAPGVLTPVSNRVDSVPSASSLGSPNVDTDLVHSYMPTDEATKYDTFVYPAGNIDDFHRGLSARIGFPHLEFLAAMEQEHCHLAGADVEFTTRNYGIRTTPRKEWLYVVAEKPYKPEPPADQLRHDRIIPDVSEKMKCQLAVDARLRKEEVIAICLYTGPMYMVYNCLLARFSKPPELFQTFEAGGNFYPTTLSVLVSAVQKLSHHTPIPNDLILYRGTGGCVSLPRNFTEPDRFNCKGMTDWGFWSSTKNKQVALDFSGVRENKPRPMILQFRPTAVDRGASVQDFSQYPKEEETLYLPCSYVQPHGSSIKTRYLMQDGVQTTLTTVPVRLNVNLKAETLEQLENKKKTWHMTSFQYRIEELRSQLKDMSREGNAASRLLRDGHRDTSITVDQLIENLVSKVQVVKKRHNDIDPRLYANESLYRSLVSESLDVCRYARSILQLWLDDSSKRIEWCGHYPLLFGHRLLVSFLKLKIATSVTVDERQHHSKLLCKVRGLIFSDNVHEANENSETPLVTAAANGASEDDLCLLVKAGADPLIRDKFRQGTILYIVAEQGYDHLIHPIIRLSVDVNAASSAGATPLYIAACNGHDSCVQTLMEAKADPNIQTREGKTAYFMAAQQGHAHVLKKLKHAADVHIAESMEGATPLHAAALSGHCECVRELISAGANVLALNFKGKTALQVAEEHKNHDVANILREHNAACTMQHIIADSASDP